MNNDKTIDFAFERLKLKKNYIIKGGLVALLRDAIQFALDWHEYEKGEDGSPKHPQHLIVGGNYGWSLLHDGVEVEREVYALSENMGYANELLDNVARGENAQRPGWVGILLAGMNDLYESYYSERFEIEVLEQTMSFTEQSFNRYFKKIG